MWFVFALLSAVFAALTSILAKVGIDGVNSNLATAIRTMVVVVMAWLMVFITNAQSGITQIGKKSWIFLFYVPQCGMYVPHCGIYVPHCGTYIPQWGT